MVFLLPKHQREIAGRKLSLFEAGITVVISTHGLEARSRLQCEQQQDVLCRRRETGISARLLPLGTELKMNLSAVGVTGRSIQRVFSGSI